MPESSATIELDEEAFAILCWLALPLTTKQLRLCLMHRFARNVTVSEVDRYVNQLKEFGFVMQTENEMVRRSTASLSEEHLGKGGAPNRRDSQESICKLGTDKVVGSSREARPPPLHTTYSEPEVVPVAPESVHLQLNNVCNLRCPSCYVDLQVRDDDSMPSERWMTLVDELADLGVFQLAIGGGEPLISPLFAPIVRHSRQEGLLPSVTTNGRALTENLLSQIWGKIGEVRLSFNDGVSVDHRLLMEKVALLKAWGVQFGFNVIVTHRNIGQLEDTMRELVGLHPNSITLIRPKPAPNNKWWYETNALSARDSMLLAEELRRMKPVFMGTVTTLTVDCAFSYLFYDLPDLELVRRGVAGCAIGERFVVVSHDGDVYPCSHLSGTEYKMGNVMVQPFRTIWERCQTDARLEPKRLEGHCRDCMKKEFCGGCRAIMWRTTGNSLAEDTSCPLRV